MDDNKQVEEIIVLKANQKNMSEKIDDLKEVVVCGFKELKDDLRKNYVSKDSFTPVRLIAYGLAGYILISVLTAVVTQAFG